MDLEPEVLDVVEGPLEVDLPLCGAIAFEACCLEGEIEESLN